MKKTLAIILAAILVLGCMSFASAEAKTYKVGVSIYQFTDNFMTLYRNEIENYFKTLETDDVKYEITMADGKNDMAEQTNQVKNFIAQGMDVTWCRHPPLTPSSTRSWLPASRWC